MINKLDMTNFKNFKQASLSLGQLSVLIGTNASGKSNIREAFRFLNGIARNYSLADIFGDKWVEGYPQWKGIRGGYREICLHGTDFFKISVVVDEFTYTIQIGIEGGKPEPARVLRESLYSNMYGRRFEAALNPKAEIAVFLPSGNTPNSRNAEETLPFPHRISTHRPLLTQLFENEHTPVEVKADIRQVVSALHSMRFIDLSPDAMRIPSNPGQTILGDRGENLSSVLQGICAKENLKQALLEWVRQLTPMDVDDFEFIPDLSGKIVLAIKERDGSLTSIHSVSDGTLRFLGLIAAIMDPQQARLYFFEELENGIHPTRLGLLIKFIEQRLRQDKGHKGLQVVTTTHSPQLLRFLSPKNQKTASLIYRLEDAPDARIRTIMEIPHISDVLQETNLADLHESGWFENVASFLEDEEHPA